MSQWIKVEKDLANDPRVLRMASRLRNADVTLASRSKLVVIGALVTLWWYADTHISDDDVLPIGADQIDELVGLTGFCEIMPTDWLQIVDANSVKLVGYFAHNGSIAKARALNQRRQEVHRNNTSNPSRSRNASVSQSALPDKSREDKNRKEKSKNQEREEALAAARAVVGLDLCAFEDWIRYRAQRKPEVKTPSLVACAKELAGYGDEQRRVVDHSMANSYQGLIAPKANSRSVVSPIKLKTAEEWEAIERARGESHA